MNITSYKNYLSSRGGTLSQIKRNQSDVIMNNTFTRDPNYKKVYVLGKKHYEDGSIAEEFSWHFVDAKYQTHSAQSISKDPVDYYLQFRPKIHYPVGTYVFVPDDTSQSINLEGAEIDSPFTQPIEKRTQCWIIVGRDESNSYVRYMILKCDWEFKWIYKGELMKCWACSKNANSYTSGKWNDEISASLDDLTQSWLPDTYHVYGEQLKSLGLCDTRTIMHGQRFFMSNNDIDPKIYEVTKIKDINPQGIIKLSIKQDELNEKRDNIELHVCDYYTDEGDIRVDIPQVEIPDAEMLSEINWLVIDNNGELIEGVQTELELGRTYYFGVNFSDNGIDPQWKINLIGNYSDEDKEYYIGLMKLTKFDSTTIALKPAKASSLKGKIFELTVSDINGNYKPEQPIVLEVAE